MVINPAARICAVFVQFSVGYSKHFQSQQLIARNTGSRLELEGQIGGHAVVYMKR